MASHGWDPDRYLTYAGERGRPFVDLVARIGATAPRTVVDLGCGPGNLTQLLASRWPQAEVSGLDSSTQMIEKAATIGDITWTVADVREWADQDGAPADVLVSNATLQWIPNHLALIPRLLDRVASSGWFACQVPGNFAEPSHTIRTELASRAPYAEHTADVAVPASHEPGEYLDVLQGYGCEVDVWETTYLHVLTGEDPVFAWVSGTGALPTLQALPDDLRPSFEDDFRRRLREAYPPDARGRVILPFRRIFAVAHKSGGKS